MTTPDRGRFASIGLAVALVLVIATAWGARVYEGRRGMLDSDAAVQRKDAVDAIMGARIAAEARCPLCTSPDRGFARLEAIARDAESRSEDAVAFAAFRAMRSASIASDGDHRDRADHEIARIGHKLDVTRTTGGTPTAAATEEKLREALAEDDSPKLASFALLAVGAIGFLAAAIRFARSGKKLPELAIAAVGAAVAATGILYF